MPLISLVLAVLLPLLLAIGAVSPAEEARSQHYVCANEPLVATWHNGAVDAADIPNSAAGTVPGAFIVLEWRGLTLQLPRTNNAGTPSYTDGRWWWQASNPDHPNLSQRTGRNGSIEAFSCQAQA